MRTTEAQALAGWYPAKRFALAASILFLLCGCSEVLGSEEADIDSVEREIAAGVRDQSGVSVSVDCPTAVAWEVGRAFHCVVEASDGSRAMADVTMENDAGDVTWQVN